LQVVKGLLKRFQTKGEDMILMKKVKQLQGGDLGDNRSRVLVLTIHVQDNDYSFGGIITKGIFICSPMKKWENKYDIRIEVKKPTRKSWYGRG